MLGSDSTLVVLLASVLKPVDDTRMRGKFAETLLSRPRTQVHVAGRGLPGAKLAAGSSAQASRIFPHPIFNGSRLSLGRLAAQWRYWRLLGRVAPAVVVVHAPELLPLTLLWHRLGRNRKFLYDIRENYALNVSTQRVYRGLLRRALAWGLRWVETRAAQRASALVLAEASYADELPYLDQPGAAPFIVLENKYQPAPGETLDAQPHALPPAHTPLRLLYSGTISELNGVREAISLAGHLRLAWPGGAQLTIVGFCQQPALLHEIQHQATQHAEWLTLIGGAEPVPHARIVAEMATSHLGLLPYRLHPSSARCRPTKLFEYLAHGLPIISSPNALWRELLRRYDAGVELNFAQPVNASALAQRLQTHVFYPAGVPSDVQWTTEGKKLWLLLDSVI